jgi:hypothetical protein
MFLVLCILLWLMGMWPRLRVLVGFQEADFQVEWGEEAQWDLERMDLEDLEEEVVQEVVGLGRVWELELECQVESGGGVRDFQKDRRGVEGEAMEADLEVGVEADIEKHDTL